MGNFGASFPHKSPVQETSKEAFHKNADNFKTMAERILSYMLSHRETRTRAEIADALGISTATMSGRVNALIGAGKLIEEPDRFTCKITGNRVRGVSAATH